MARIDQAKLEKMVYGRLHGAVAGVMVLTPGDPDAPPGEPRTARILSITLEPIPRASESGTHVARFTVRVQVSASEAAGRDIGRTIAMADAMRVQSLLVSTAIVDVATTHVMEPYDGDAIEAEGSSDQQRTVLVSVTGQVKRTSGITIEEPAPL